MPLTLHRAPRTDLLADELAGLLATPVGDPFAQELVVVPARGVERWLAQRLSHRLGAGPSGGDGVCAGVRFVSPRSLVALLLGTERDDPWDPDRMVWPLLRVIDAHLGEPWLRTLARHLGEGWSGTDREVRRTRRYAVARRLAGLFASYAVQRPRLLTDWWEWRDTDGLGQPLEEDLTWEAELWRRLIGAVGADPPARRHSRAVQRLRDDPAEFDLPARLSLFGHTRIPVTEIELLTALGEHREVHLWLPQASTTSWERLADTAAGGPVPRRQDRSAALVGHPLLASLGRDSRELQRTLSLAGGTDRPHGPSGQTPPRTLLGRLQQDLRADAAPDAATRAGRTLDPEDRTVQVHACHGQVRQVEVLREVLAGLLADDPTLEPRDILVMCPDIETFAPLIQAGFGLGEVTGADGTPGHPAHRLRVMLADRALTSTNPLLALAAALVRLASGRVTATAVLDLVAVPEVQRRFHLSGDDLERLTRWTRQAEIRWGLDEEHRAAYRVPTGQNTWRFGLDRLLAGVAVAEEDEHAFEQVLPVDDVGSEAVDLAGRFAELVDRLDAALDRLGTPGTARDWANRLGASVATLAATSEADAWQVAQLDRELSAIAEAGQGTDLRLSDVAALLDGRLAGRPTRASFRVGTLTVCTMVPMRSVPHRVVCLLGLDDGTFPRVVAVDGDDVLARTPLTGERDVRSEDRQLLLDAVLAATETLVVTYTGADEHTGAPRPPAVPLGELIDAVLATAPVPRERLVTRHPLQPFDPRNFAVQAGDPPDNPGLPRPFSFDTAGLAGACAARGPRRAVTTLLDEPLPPLPPGDLALADLHRFFRGPAAAFLRGRLDVATPLEPDETSDAIPVALGNLEQWSVADRMLRRLLDGASPDAVCSAELHRGQCPPGPLGEQALRGLVTEVAGLYNATAPLRRQPRRDVDVDLDLGGGRRLTGTVTDVYGEAVVRVAYSRLAATHRLASWLDLLAVTAAHPHAQWTAHAVGRAARSAHDSVVRQASCGPLSPADALGHLRRLVEVVDLGQCFPAPLPPRTALAYAEATAHAMLGKDVDPVAAAGRQWQTDRDAAYGLPGENTDRANERVYGPSAPVEVLLGPPRDGECWSDQPTRLGQYAWALWEPLLLGAERVSSR